jgi:hypothetical protein
MNKYPPKHLITSKVMSSPPKFAPKLGPISVNKAKALKAGSLIYKKTSKLKKIFRKKNTFKKL